MVQWRNRQYKKHKTWDGDAILVVNRSKCTLFDSEGKIMSTGKAEAPLFEGKSFFVGAKEVELDRPVLRTEFLSGQCFGRHNSIQGRDAFETQNDLAHVKKFVSPVVMKKPLEGAPPGVRAGCLKSENGPPQNFDGVASNVRKSYWTANWRKQQNKKHKTWDGDAYISHEGDKLTMISEDGKIMGSTAWKGELLCAGYSAYISGKEFQLDCEISRSQLPDMKEISLPEESTSHVEDPLHFSGQGSTTNPSVAHEFISPASFYAIPKSKPKGPLHDPDAADAVVMKFPSKEHTKRFNTYNLNVVPVVLDPILSRRMRPHQKEGVMFLYECVMGLRKHEGQGCILADEMGLGKTLQTIALIWTLLKQNLYGSKEPAAKKVLIVCPVSLTTNWKAEFNKWLGKDRVGVVICEKDKSRVNQFFYNKNQHVLVIGYERLRTVIDTLSSGVPAIDLIVCDEGHRLKSANNKTTAILKALRTPRRVILSGTPIQNDLGEFHAMAEFCNPGLLDDYNVFRRVYESPILKSRAPDASAKEIEIGETRTAQLLSISSSFVLRRDATLLKNHLPPKYEYVVFVTPTALQLSMFSKILRPDRLIDLVQSSTAESLALINILTKISNSPILLKAAADKAKIKTSGDAPYILRTGVDEALGLLPDTTHFGDFSLSGKLIALAKLLTIIRHTTEEKCVLVSHYTSTLNILEAFCQKKGYSYYRLDGQTPQVKRQEYVNAFNNVSQRSSFIFLLSSKAGGLGINLIGASRLCLIDSDWNPSHDLQSMARCHRDGQKRPVFIYRFLTTGAIDEKIYQRQVTKLGLSASLIGSAGSSSASKTDSFSRKELRDIFRIHPDTICNTHDLLECQCEESGGRPSDTCEEVQPVDPNTEDNVLERGFIAASNVKMDASDPVDTAKKKAALALLSEWKHINCQRSGCHDLIHDHVLRKLVQEGEEAGGSISFLFEKGSESSEEE